PHIAHHGVVADLRIRATRNPLCNVHFEARKPPCEPAEPRRFPSCEKRHRVPETCTDDAREVARGYLVEVDGDDVTHPELGEPFVHEGSPASKPDDADL